MILTITNPDKIWLHALYGDEWMPRDRGRTDETVYIEDAGIKDGHYTYWMTITETGGKSIGKVDILRRGDSDGRYRVRWWKGEDLNTLRLHCTKFPTGGELTDEYILKGIEIWLLGRW
jgi:hypothetical protein